MSPIRHSTAVLLAASVAALLPAAAGAAPARPATPVVTVSGGGFAVVTVPCPVAARCAGTVQLRAAAGRAQRLGVATFGSTGRRVVRVGVRLNDVAVGRLVRAGSLPVRAVVTTRVGRRVGVAERRLTLRKPPAPPAPVVSPSTAPPSASASASFVLRSVRGASFLCRLDAAPWVRCANPAVITGLGDGEHVLRVRASHRVRGLSAVTVTTLRAGGPAPVAASPVPADVPPVAPPVAPPTPVVVPPTQPAPNGAPDAPTIDAKPDAQSTSSRARFSYSSPGGTYSYRCSLDGATFAACTSPVTYNGLALGAHTFAVKALSTGGESAATTHSWTVVPLLPDLMAGIRHFGVRTIDLGGSPYDGQKGLFFSTDVINVGNGPLEIRTNPTTCDSPDGTGRVATQRVFRDRDGNGIFNRPADESGATDSEIGCLAYHAAHRHTHFQEFGVYELFAYANGTRGPRVSLSDKISYCMIDELRHENFDAPAEPANAFYPYAQVCQGTDDSIMGISVGWNDQYGASRPDQFVPLGGVPDGTYCLQVRTDYLNRLDETNDANNDASVRVTVSGTTVTPQSAVTVNQLRC